ncbi:hypothetical protein EJ06DRAFT_73717 [Trichodelitschia bisporula]|uniref:Uncharacterized protein n=1 Tax=Trichodelitschia bisporula TaxID=703511 RepID=A0A6G1HTC5_9PEZI|nr:hypothetical protein EJ06DRAFT_73717 [Trichodelitschia bisporula]
MRIRYLMEVVVYGYCKKSTSIMCYGVDSHVLHFVIVVHFFVVFYSLPFCFLSTVDRPRFLYAHSTPISPRHVIISHHVQT